MKAHKLLTCMISLLLVVGVSSCDSSKYKEYTLSELNSLSGSGGFIHEGEYVSVKGLTVAGQHGNTFVAYDDDGSVAGYLPVC